MSGITYRTGGVLDAESYAGLLRDCSLGERRPVDSLAALAAMLRHANLLVTAWDGEMLVGACRCFSDFLYVTYCSDLAVRDSHQRQGIGRELLRRTLEVAPCRLVLLAAPQAVDYYPRLGFERHVSAWTIRPGELL